VSSIARLVSSWTSTARLTIYAPLPRTSAPDPILVIPEPIAALSSRNVLTMKYLQGMHIDSIEPGANSPKKAALNLIEGAYQMVFEDGLFHSDPHPGNLVVLPDGRVGVMDFGQVGKTLPRPCAAP